MRPTAGHPGADRRQSQSASTLGPDEHASLPSMRLSGAGSTFDDAACCAGLCDVRWDVCLCSGLQSSPIMGVADCEAYLPSTVRGQHRAQPGDGATVAFAGVGAEVVRWMG